MKSSTYLYAKISRAILPAGVLLFACLFSGTMAWSQSRGNLAPTLQGAEANLKIKGAEFIRQGTNTPYPALVRMSESSHVTVDQFVPWLKKSLQLPAGTDFKLLKQEGDKLGIKHYRFQQTHQNVPLDNGEYVVNTKGDQVLWFSGKIVPAPKGLSTTPKLDEAQALNAAMKAIGAKEYKWQNERWTSDLRKRTGDPNATYLPEGTLCWSVSDDNRSMILSWRFDIWSSNPDKFQRIYVDANTGNTLKQLPMESNCSSATVNTVFNGNRTIFTDNYVGTTFRLRDDCRGTGGGNAEFWVRDWASATMTNNMVEIQNNTNTWTTNNERFGGSVLWLTRQAYDYWQTTFSRNSYDNGGGDVNGFINAKFDCSPPAGCVSDFNASMSFTGGTMKVGKGSGFADGYATVDIIGHEFTHAVTGATSQLVYANESGALNESFSDIFGEMNERFVFGSNDWLLGDERSSGAIRDMADPNNFNNPDTYQGSFWQFGGGDNGGVHTNSGVQNFWFYLLVNGGSGTNDNSDAYTVSGVGVAVASYIAHVNQITLSNVNSTYQDARDNSIAVATAAYGACSNVTKQVTNAWYAVGVGDPFFDATASVTSNYNGRHVSCFNSCNGSATVTVTSGVAPTYSWSPGGAITQSISGLCPGVYTVTVTNHDAAACSVSRSVTILNTPLLVTNPAVTSNYNGRDVSCFGATDGSATANVGGGTGTKSYSWNTIPVQTTATATGLGAGNYTVTVTDANGCVAVGNVSLTNPPLLVTNPASTSNYNGYNVSCFGATDGSATANAAGGTGTKSYSWNTVPVQTTATATGLGAGTYTVTVTDANGCVAAKSVTLTQPPLLTTSAAPITNYNGYNVSCFGGSNGAAEAYPAGGVAPYTYSWNTVPVQTTKIATGLSAQNYIVNVTDLNGCGASANTTLTEPPPLTIDAGPNKTVYYGYPDSACATLTATGIGGGVPPYTLSWSTSATTASITVCPITSTVYYVTVTDLNGCTKTDSVRVCVIDVRCGNKLDKVELCHNTGSTKNPTETLCVALSAAKIHLATHGCQLAACGTNKVCTFGGGGFARISPTAGLQGDVQLTAFPNPFGDYTNVRFMVPTEQNVRIGLYDISGREMRSLFNGPAKANVIYDERLDGSALPAGMYFLNMKLENGESYSGKLVITK